MKKRTRTYLFRTAAFLAAAGLLYLALRQADLASIAEALREADYRWAIPAIGAVLVAHLLRAWRWQILLNTLPGSERSADEDTPPEEANPPAHPSGAGNAEGPTPAVGLVSSFGSLMIGYMVNYAAPRLGEIARTVNLSRREHLSFSAVFGTVVIERVLDVTVLALALGSALLILADRVSVVIEMLGDPTLRMSLGPAIDWLMAGAGVAILVLLVAGGYRLWGHARSGRLGVWWTEYLRPTLKSFVRGVRTLFRTDRPVAVIVLTAALWVGYVLMAYLPFLMLDMTGPHDLGLVSAWVIMGLGALGIAVPVPGGTGSYHYITTQALIHLYGVDAASAFAYAVLTHGGQMIIQVVVGIGFFLWEGATWKRLRREQETAPTPNSSAR